MFSLVKAAKFLLFSHAEAHGLLDDEEDEACCSEARDSVGEDANSLSAERVVTGDIEDTDSERTPDTVDEVNRESTDRVIQVQAVEHEDCTDDEHTSDSTDNPRRKRGHDVCTSGDSDET